MSGSPVFVYKFGIQIQSWDKVYLFILFGENLNLYPGTKLIKSENITRVYVTSYLWFKELDFYFYLESHLHLELGASFLENDYCNCWKTVHIHFMTQSYVEICFYITQSKAIFPGSIILTYKTLTGITILACITDLSFPEGQQAI